jgi:hypothetical protein
MDRARVAQTAIENQENYYRTHPVTFLLHYDANQQPEIGNGYGIGSSISV